jgi:D-3-phosphoglycerate dehydrogenase
MNILIADKFSHAGIDALQDMGHTVHGDASLDGPSLEAVLETQKPHVLVVRSTRVTAAMMDANPTLELIVRAGAGYDTIDVQAASDRGIFVANCPGKNAVAVAELAFGLILALDRQIPDNVAQARQGKWNKVAFSKADGLKGKTLGLIGLGHIGQEVAYRARAFDLQVVAWSRSLTDGQARALGVIRLDSLREVAEMADIVSVHVASTPATQHLINDAFFEAMRPGAYLINTSRGDVVDETALLNAIETKGIRAGLDVFNNEPSSKEGSFTHPLAQHPNVYLTHHIGASTQQASDAIGDEAVRVMLMYAETGDVPNCVNMAEQTDATHMLTVRHLDKVGVLAAVLDDIRKADWNVQEMENLVFAGAAAACARIRFSGVMDETTVAQIQTHPDVIAVSVLNLT